jgi:hypothetical protein
MISIYYFASEGKVTQLPTVADGQVVIQRIARYLA